MKASNFYRQSAKDQGQGEVQHAENAYFYWTDFHQTFSVDAFWSSDERFSVWDQKVKGHRGSIGWRRTKLVRECVNESIVIVQTCDISESLMKLITFYRRLMHGHR